MLMVLLMVDEVVGYLDGEGDGAVPDDPLCRRGGREWKELDKVSYEEDVEELDKVSYEDCLALPVLTYSPILPLPADAVRPQPLPQHHLLPSRWPNMTWRW